MKKLQINIFNTDLEWLGIVDDIFSFIHRSSWHEIPISELRVSKSAQGVEELQIGRILLINNQLDKALIIEDMAASLDDLYWSFTCIPLKGMMNYRICYPWDSGSYSQKSQSYIMAELTRQNLVTQTRDNDRKFLNSVNGANMFSVAANKTYGDIVDFTIDWETGYLGDTLISISKMFGAVAKYPLGWNVYIKPDYSGFEMDVWHGTHKHINQTDLSPVVFSEEFGNIKNASYEYSIKEWRNIVYMIYEDVNNVAYNVPVGNIDHGPTKGFNRKEIIINSSKKTDPEAIAEGYAELNKRPHIENFTAEIVNNTNTMSTYNEDWFLGDIVTVQSKEIKRNEILSLDVMITEIEEIYDQGEYSINATFGEGKLTLIQLVKNAINQK
jgi:hypothetical protein